jgi:hypothetical protein
MRLDMPKLHTICLDNTCITIDFVKTLSKHKVNYGELSVPSQTHFNCLYFFQKAIAMFADYLNVGIML